MVIEIISPSGETWQKLDFYFQHDVSEMLVVDPIQRSVTWLTRGESTMMTTDVSRILSLSADALHGLLDWPPIA